MERQSAGLLVWLRVRAFALQVKDLGLVISNYKKKKKGGRGGKLLNRKFLRPACNVNLNTWKKNQDEMLHQLEHLFSQG